MKLKGKLVVLEGIDCAGKSTIIKALKKKLKNSKVKFNFVGEMQSPISNLISDILKNNDTPFIKAFLFASDRAWTYEKQCLPALKKGEFVIWDRYVDSALIYRKVEFQIKKSLIKYDFVKAINSPFKKADLTFIIDISARTSVRRAKEKKRVEPYKIDFLKKARIEYKKLSNKRNYFIIDGNKNISEIQSVIIKKIKKTFCEF